MLPNCMVVSQRCVSMFLLIFVNLMGTCGPSGFSLLSGSSDAKRRQSPLRWAGCPFPLRGAACLPRRGQRACLPSQLLTLLGLAYSLGRQACVLCCSGGLSHLGRLGAPPERGKTSSRLICAIVSSHQQGALHWAVCMGKMPLVSALGKAGEHVKHVRLHVTFPRPVTE